MPQEPLDNVIQCLSNTNQVDGVIKVSYTKSSYTSYPSDSYPQWKMLMLVIKGEWSHLLSHFCIWIHLKSTQTLFNEVASSRQSFTLTDLMLLIGCVYIYRCHTVYPLWIDLKNELRMNQKTRDSMHICICKFFFCGVPNVDIIFPYLHAMNNTNLVVENVLLCWVHS